MANPESIAPVILQKFTTGQIIFHRGDPSDSVFRIVSGRVEILRALGDEPVLLGTVAAGEFLGEMSLLEERRHSATARAASDVEAELVTRAQFFEQVSSDPVLARAMMLRLSRRLRSADDKVEDLSFSGPKATAAGFDISIAALTPRLESALGHKPIMVDHLPFVVGRHAADAEFDSRIAPNLMIDDKKPFRLSRNHFAIEIHDGHVAVHDLNSTLGTIVNGNAIGPHFQSDTAILVAGGNLVLAGGVGSPFVFQIAVEPR